MAVGTWKIYTRAKRNIMSGANAMSAGGITLGAGVFKLALYRTSASAQILKISNGGISTYGTSLPGEISATGNYVAGGLALKPATGRLTVGASTKQMKFTYTATGLTFKASGASLNNIRYAAVRTSSGAGAGKLVCFVTLSTAAFTIALGNTLTISPASTGVFTFA